jgi:hypothetical protein
MNIADCITHARLGASRRSLRPQLQQRSIGDGFIPHGNTPLPPVKYHLTLSTIIFFGPLSARPRLYTDLISETSVDFY